MESAVFLELSSTGLTTGLFSLTSLPLPGAEDNAEQPVRKRIPPAVKNRMNKRALSPKICLKIFGFGVSLQTPDCFFFYLSYSFTGQIKFFTNFFECQ